MKKSEFLKRRQEWRDRWNAFFESESSEDIPGNFELDWRCIVTCHAEGCPNGGRSYIARISEQLDGVYRVQCGMCGNAIDDLDPMLEDDEEFRLETFDSSWLIPEEQDD